MISFAFSLCSIVHARARVCVRVCMWGVSCVCVRARKIFLSIAKM